MKCLAIIPARGGSKRIPHKNIKPFLGRPIIAYSIEAALGSGLFEEDQPVEERLRGNRHTAFGPHHTDRGHLPQLHGRGDALSVPFFIRYPFRTSFLS